MSFYNKTNFNYHKIIPNIGRVNVMSFGKKVLPLIFIDGIIIILSAIAALALRFDFNIPIEFINPFKLFIFIFTALSLISLYFSKVYHSIWRYASISDLFGIIKGFSISILVSVIIIYFSPLNLVPFSRGVFIITVVNSVFCIGGTRFLWRVISGNEIKESNKELKKALIIGAGEAGLMVVKELKRTNGLKVNPVGFVDDEPLKYQRYINGLPVLGNRHSIPTLVENYNIDEIIIAIPSAPKSVIREIVQICKETKANLKTLPGLYEFIEGKLNISNIRDVDVEDLLGRETVQVNLDEIAGYMTSKVVLVTGAGGSIGSEICRQACRFNPKKLILLGHGENDIFDMEIELRQNFPNQIIETEIADIKDKAKMTFIFENHSPQVVFHAAAHKHVPLMEKNPDEAIKNNVMGTKNVAEAADKAGTDVFVMISTDKAVNPSSVMGASKRVAEMVIQHMDTISQTRFVAVRFGNVLGSRGSVIPLFKKQIAMGGPVTITHPEMVRYFMTIPEATQLVIQAGAMAKGGEIFILDMGEPVKISDLANDLIRLSGFEPGKDIEIKFTGIRPGEKLYEEILTSEEGTSSTKHERIFVAKPNKIEVNMLKDFIDNMTNRNFGQNHMLIIENLIRLIPTFKPQNRKYLGKKAI